MSCFGRQGIESYFPGVEFYAVASGRVGAPPAGGYRAKDGTAIVVTHQFPDPTIISIRAHKPLTKRQRVLLATCT